MRPGRDAEDIYHARAPCSHVRMRLSVTMLNRLVGSLFQALRMWDGEQLKTCARSRGENLSRLSPLHGQTRNVPLRVPPILLFPLSELLEQAIMLVTDVSKAFKLRTRLLLSFCIDSKNVIIVTLLRTYLTREISLGKLMILLIYFSNLRESWHLC